MTTMTRSEESTATTAVPRHAAQNDPAVGGQRLMMEVLSPSRPANVAYRPLALPEGEWGDVDLSPHG